MSGGSSAGREPAEEEYEPYEAYEEAEEPEKREKYERYDSGDSTVFPSAEQSDSEHQYESIIHDDDRAELRRLATALSRTKSSAASTTDLERRETITGLAPDDPVFDPSSKSFSLYKWAKRFVRSLDEEGRRTKRAGVVFRDLNVSGSGSALQLQQTVGSLLMAPLRVGEFFSIGKKPHKKILRSFDGIMKSGELLIVLGRPGSGCSTLLKSMTGELHGLALDSNSTIHYNGIPQKQMMKEFKGEVVYNQEVRETSCPEPIIQR